MRQAPSRSSTLPAGTTAFRDLSYVPHGHERQKLDLYLPKLAAGKAAPLVILIHGGAFLSGSKDGENPGPLAGAGLCGGGGRLPAQRRRALSPRRFRIARRRSRWLRTNAAKYRLSPNRFAAMGWSAGGHLAAMLGTSAVTRVFDRREGESVSSGVQAVVDYFGPTDFLQMDAQRLPGGDAHDPADSPESRLIGGALQENKVLASRASPISFVSKYSPPFLIAHGTRDAQVPPRQSESLAAELKKVGVPVELYLLSGAAHMFAGAKPADLAALNRKTVAFLARYLKP